jgi:hypothetical protein
MTGSQASAEKWCRTNAQPVKVLYAWRRFRPKTTGVATMARKKKLDFSDIADVRKKQNINQTEFWTRFGVPSRADRATSPAATFPSRWRSCCGCIVRAR